MKEVFRISPKGSEEAGENSTLFSWNSNGSLLAIAHVPGRILQIFDGYGHPVVDVSLSGDGEILSIEWDREGKTAAVLQEGQSKILLWTEASPREPSFLETNLSNPTFVKWSPGPQMAIATHKGNLLLYNHETKKKIPILGKHPSAIICGAWSSRNELVLGSQDGSLTVSDDGGNTILQIELPLKPLGVSFAYQEPHKTKGSVVCIHLEESLFLKRVSDQLDLELSFEPDYGSIVSYSWFKDHILVGFSNGLVLCLAAHLGEAIEAEEVWSCQIHEVSLFDFAYSAQLEKAVTIGDDGTKLIDLQHGSLEGVVPVASDLHHVAWSPDGQVLASSTLSGDVIGLGTKVALIQAYHGTKVAFLSKNKQVTCVDSNDATQKGQVLVDLEKEPDILSLGPSCVAAGVGNSVAYYNIQGDETVPDIELEYAGAVKHICLNEEFAAVLHSDRIDLHCIRCDNDAKITFPNEDSKKVTCAALTPHFLIIGTDSKDADGGTIELIFLRQLALFSEKELHHPFGIKSIYPNKQGTRVAFIDRTESGFLFNPINLDVIPIPEFPPSVEKLLWDQCDDKVLNAYDGSLVHSYVHAPVTIRGPLVMKLGPLQIDEGGGVSMVPSSFGLDSKAPITVCNGKITCLQEHGGGLTTTTSPFYTSQCCTDGRSNAEHEMLRFTQSLSLLRLWEAWKASLIISKRPIWLALAHKSLDVMNLEVARLAYTQLGDAGMADFIDGLRYLEDKNLLAGHLAVLFMDYAGAERLFLASSNPLAALDMRMELFHWDKALSLARSIAPEKVPDVSAKYAKRLELQGEHHSAAKMFESALNLLECDSEQNPERANCLGGIARNSLRMGNYNRGVHIAKTSQDKELLLDCAELLLSMDQHVQAASLFEACDQFNKAAEIYLDFRKLPNATKIIRHVTCPKLLSIYGKACEVEGDYTSAENAYEQSHDDGALVRLCLLKTDQPDRALNIVRSNRSVDGALLASQHCQKNGNLKGVIEFMLIAKLTEDAFEFAKTNDCIDLYADEMGDNMTKAEANRLAQYYQQREGCLGQAGRLYSIGGQYMKATQIFIQCGEEYIESAIDAVGLAKDDDVTHVLLDFLMGEVDGQPKAPEYVLKLYMALGKFSEAASTAIIISQQEQQIDGNYAKAHQIIGNTVRQMEEHNAHVPQALRRAFVLLHSYHLVKIYAKRGDHDTSARLLLRIAKQISKFPQHQVRILISTVIECQKSGLKSSAYELATLLCSKKEFKQELDSAPGFKKKIQAIVRRPSRDEEKAEMQTYCPISKQLIPATQLECPTTKDAIPMCICTGKHMELDNWCFCPSSGMPALYSEYVKYVELETVDLSVSGEATEIEHREANMTASYDRRSGMKHALDPVFGEQVFLEDLTKVSTKDALGYIRTYNSFSPICGEETA